MVSVSLCMIVRDEEDVLSRCLDSIKDAVDEIIIVDTGSLDSTKQIALKYTDKVYDFVWQDDFSLARNYSFGKATKDYIIWLDADDYLTCESMDKLRELKQKLNPDTDMVMMPYQVAFDSEGKCTFSYWRERIVRRGRGLLFQGKVHEAITPSGNIIYADIPIKHLKLKVSSSDRNLRIYEKMEQNNEHFEPRALYYYGRELLQNGLLEKACLIFEKFLLCPHGYIENKIDASRQLAVARKQLGDEAGELRALLQTFEYDVPRGETCCSIGRYFFDKNAFAQAYYWYMQALLAKRANLQGAFIEEECYGYLPAIMLCVCCDRMGKFNEANDWNELAGQFKPYSEEYLSNRIYFREHHNIKKE